MDWAPFWSRPGTSFEERRTRFAGRTSPYISASHLDPHQIPEQFITGAPDLAVEILSASSRWPDVEEILADYLASGARMVWVVEPRERRVVVRYPDRPSRILTGGDVLDGEDVVPGFRLALADLFGHG